VHVQMMVKKKRGVVREGETRTGTIAFNNNNCFNDASAADGSVLLLLVCCVKTNNF